MEELVTRPAEPVPRQTAHVIKKQTPPPQETDPGVLARRLRELLEPALNGSVEERDRIVNSYGFDFGRLVTLLEPFTQSPERREQSLRLSGLITEDQ